MATLWCEARCAGMGTADIYGSGHLKCRETATGAFGVKNATRMARDEGWKVFRGEWHCPICIRRKKDPTNG